MSQDCCLARSSTRSFTVGQVDTYAGVDVALIMRTEPQPKIGRLADVSHDFRGSDQGLRGNAVGENGRAAQPIDCR